MPVAGARDAGAALIAGAALGAGPLPGVPFGGAPPVPVCAAAGNDSAATIATAGTMTVRNLILPMPEFLLLFWLPGLACAPQPPRPQRAQVRRDQLWQSMRDFAVICAVFQPQFQPPAGCPYNGAHAHHRH